MSQQARNQSVTAQSTTPQPNQPQPTNNKPDAFARLAEAVDGALNRLNHPKAEKSSFRHEPVRLVPAPAEKTSASRGLPCGSGLQPRQEARPDGASSPSVRSGSSTVAQAKNYLRATRSPKFLRPNRSLERHARKCAICRHPEREMIEELFIRWHSPEAIANFLDDHDQINWVSIYRHAYALGLDAVRRRNLGYVFENILDNAADATPTAAGVVAAARALGCIGEDGRWVEPEKRILMTTIVRKEDSSATTSTDPDNSASSSEGPTEFSSSLPKAAVDTPVAAPQTPPSGQLSAARENESVAAPATALPEAAFDAPAAAKRTPSPRLPTVSRSATREIRLPLNSQKTKDKPISNR